MAATLWIRRSGFSPSAVLGQATDRGVPMVLAPNGDIFLGCDPGYEHPYVRVPPPPKGTRRKLPWCILEQTKYSDPRGFLELAREFYEKRREALGLWAAILFCDDYGLSLPEWVTKELPKVIFGALRTRRFPLGLDRKTIEKKIETFRLVRDIEYERLRGDGRRSFSLKEVCDARYRVSGKKHPEGYKTLKRLYERHRIPDVPELFVLAYIHSRFNRRGAEVRDARRGRQQQVIAGQIFELRPATSR